VGKKRRNNMSGSKDQSGGKTLHGIEAVLLLASTDSKFRKQFAKDRDSALADAGIELTSQERSVLDSVRDQELFATARTPIISKKGKTIGTAMEVATLAAIALIGTAVIVPNTLGSQPDIPRPHSTMPSPEHPTPTPSPEIPNQGENE
jgi:hypothetical protein